MTNAQILAALDEYDAAAMNVSAARDRVRRADEAVKRAVGARHDVYMDSNELVAALGRKLAENIRAANA